MSDRWTLASQTCYRHEREVRRVVRLTEIIKKPLFALLLILLLAPP